LQGLRNNLLQQLFASLTRPKVGINRIPEEAYVPLVGSLITKLITVLIG